ncbi:helix-turn-helix domain-containing protein [Halobacteriaceae archaeon SHR40]|uniref:TrmB family transcriptional regulator n=1 Tax=Halovenus amylolytica TaxID=2500550 RepID=UPI000FE30E4F
MTKKIHQDRAVEKLQQFGLREYEAKCFVSLTKITGGTAREVSEHIDIPRTRVYEAVRSLESAGLVEIQHSSPQQFRAIPITEAIEILNERHQTRINSIEQSLREIQQASQDEEANDRPEIWSMTGRKTITTRVKRLIGEADVELLLLIGNESVLSEPLYQELSAAGNREVDIVVGAESEQLRDQLSMELPEWMVYSAEIEWLRSDSDPTAPDIGRLLLVDGQYLLASTIRQGEQSPDEQAVCGSGNCNGLVLVLRRLLDEQLPNPQES